MADILAFRDKSGAPVVDIDDILDKQKAATDKKVNTDVNLIMNSIIGTLPLCSEETLEGVRLHDYPESMCFISEAVRAMVMLQNGQTHPFNELYEKYIDVSYTENGTYDYSLKE